MSTPTPKSDTPALGSPDWLRAEAESTERLVKILGEYTGSDDHSIAQKQIAGLRAAADALEKAESDALTIDFIFENCGYLAIKQVEAGALGSFKRCYNREQLKEALTLKLTKR